MQVLPIHERRQYVRASLFVDIELAVMDKDAYEAVRRSEPRKPSRRFGRQAAVPFDEGGQYDAGSAFYPNLINFLINIDDKLDRVLKVLSKVSGPEVAASNADKGHEELFVGQGSEISGTGMSVVCDNALQPGQILKARFVISRFPLIPLVLFGQVVRVMPVEEDGKQRYQVILRFIDLDEEDREKIIAYTFQAQRDAIRKEKKEKESNNV